MKAVTHRGKLYRVSYRTTGEAYAVTVEVPTVRTRKGLRLWHERRVWSRTLHGEPGPKVRAVIRAAEERGE